MIKKTDEAVSLALLARMRVGRLGCVLENGEPYVVPVNYLYKDGAIYVHSLRGQKITAMKANPRVCLQTDEVSRDGFSWNSVIAFGDFEEVSDKEMKDQILEVIYRTFPAFTPVEAKLDEKAVDRETIVFQIVIRNVTGVSETS